MTRPTAILLLRGGTANRRIESRNPVSSNRKPQRIDGYLEAALTRFGYKPITDNN